MLGSALGGGARYLVSGLAANHFGETFPWGTLIVNVTGSFIIGFFATLTGPDGRLLVRTEERQFVDDRHLRRLHDLLILQPADAQSRARRRNRARGREYRHVVRALA